MKQRKIDSIAHCCVTCRVGMDMVARIVDGSNIRRVERVAHKGVKVDHAIERAACAYPGVHLLTSTLLCCCKATRNDRRPDDAQTSRVHPSDDFSHTGNDSATR